MRVLVTGHHGYIGSVMVDVLAKRAMPSPASTPSCTRAAPSAMSLRPSPIRKDIRDVEPCRPARLRRGHPPRRALERSARLPQRACTYDINHLGSVRLARAAKEARRAAIPVRLVVQPVRRRPATTMLDETAAFNPITAYGASKVLVEQDVAKLADDTFSPTYLRNATAYGASPRLRADIVVNNLVGVAFTTGEVVIQSDGTPWRPLVHIEDISRAFLAVLEAPREAVHNQAFNVGSSHGELPDPRRRRRSSRKSCPAARSSTSKAAGRIRAATASTATS